VLFAYKPLLDYAERADDVRVQQAASTLDSAQLATSHPEAEALITLITHRIDSQVLTCRPALRVVANVAAGIDNIDVAAASRLGILICNVPGAVEETTADLTFGLIISACRQLTAAEQQLRTGRWTRWELDANLGMDVHDANLGLVGFGAIGQAVVRRASGFGMTVRHHTRRPTGRPGWTASLLELPENADIVSVHVPLTADTVGLIGPRELSVMKPSAVLVNTSRGGIVDEEAPAAALEEHRLFGAGLDVFVGEPAVNPRLLGCPWITLLPHIGSATLATRRRMETRAFEAALAAVRGVVPNGAVNAESWQRR
jgi:glyoxylate reductase